MDAIALIEQFTSGMDFETFRSSPMAVSAVERKLQIISEAATRLGDEAERQIPDQPWRDIRGISNQLRHAYERIDLNTIWNTVTGDLPPLKAAVMLVLDPPKASPKGPFRAESGGGRAYHVSCARKRESKFAPT